MSKYAFTTLFLFSCACNIKLSAQQYFSLGPVFGLGHSAVTNGNMSTQATHSVKTLFNPRFSAGLGIIYAQKEHWGFGGEVLFAQDGYKKQISIKSGSHAIYDEINTVNYIHVPLRAYYFFGAYESKVRPKVYAGPSLSLKINDDFERAEIDEPIHFPDVDDRYYFQSFDIGFHVGAGLNINISKSMWLNIDLNYFQGLLDAVDDGFFAHESGYNMNQRLQFQAGLLFGLGN